ncbi:hypothetical protein AWENTII_003125 [Aspergillus wentii]
MRKRRILRSRVSPQSTAAKAKTARNPGQMIEIAGIVGRTSHPRLPGLTDLEALRSRGPRGTKHDLQMHVKRPNGAYGLPMLMSAVIIIIIIILLLLLLAGSPTAIFMVNFCVVSTGQESRS